MTLAIILLLLLANAFFVAAEFALVKVRDFRLKTMADEDRFGARLSMRIHADMEPYLAACQLGITMASLGLGWVGEPFVAAIVKPVFVAMNMSTAALHTVSFLIGFVVFSSLHIVVGEQVPKTWAIRTAESMVRWCAWPLRAFYLVVYPLNWLLNRAAAGMLSLFGVREAGHGEVLTGSELRGLIETSGAHGEINASQAEMHSNLFAFDQRTVARIMIPRADVAVLNVDETGASNLETLKRHRHSRFPAIDSAGTPQGIVLVKDLYMEMLESGEVPAGTLGKVIREPLIVPEALRVPDLFDAMRSTRAHMAVVVDEYGQFIGVVTLEDLLEEIVGDIQDETDSPEVRYPITREEDAWLVHGLASLADVERTTGMTIPDDLNANTLSGLVMLTLGRMPDVGDTVDAHGFRVEALDVEDHHVSRARLSRPDPSPNPDSTG